MKEKNQNAYQKISSRRIMFVIILNFLITATEIAGGLIAHSLSLLSDALHNLTDGFAILTSFFALRLGQRRSTTQMTFGFKRAEILAALFNSSILIIIIFFLLKEAASRLFSPHIINSNLMLTVAIVGLLANLVGVTLLKKDADHNLNIKSAYLHLFADSLSSIGIVIGGLLIKFFNIYIIDPILTVVISIYILRESYFIFRNTINILMQSTPDGIDIREIKSAIESIPEVHNLHHVHVWQMTDRDIHFEGHIDICNDLRTSEVADIIKKIEEILLSKFNITHTTIQVEFGTCSDKEVIRKCDLKV
ncbi:MAG: cation diffusion facilitator family transporter [candidate division WOR-3 bacterium]